MHPSLAGGLLVFLLAAVQVGPAWAYDCSVCMSSSSMCVNAFWTGYLTCNNGVGDALHHIDPSTKQPKMIVSSDSNLEQDMDVRSTANLGLPYGSIDDAHPMYIRVPRFEVLEAFQSSPACKWVTGDAAPLKVYAPMFLQKDITQNTPYPMEPNTLSVTLMTNIPLTAGTLIISTLSRSWDSSLPQFVFTIKAAVDINYAISTATLVVIHAVFIMSAVGVVWAIHPQTCSQNTHDRAVGSAKKQAKIHPRDLPARATTLCKANKAHKSDKTRKKRPAVSMALTGGLLGTLVLAAQVGPARACYWGAYCCTSAAECAYEGCNDISCSGYEGISSCNNGVWDAICRWDNQYVDTGRCYVRDTYNNWPYGYVCPEPAACVAGTYSDSGKNGVGDRACQPCPSGTFQNEIGASECTDCVAGKYAAEGASECTDCVAGKYATGGASSCTDCNAAAGNYCPPGSTSSEQVPCPAGFTCPGGSSDKQACPKGTFLSSTGNDAESDCVACPAGKFLSTYGNDAESDCVTCEASPGFYCPAGSTSAEGVFCPAGSYCPGFASDKQACPVGTFSPNIGAAECTKCQSGTSSASKGALSESSCTQCPTGKFAEAGASDCTKCGAGKFSSSWGAESEAICTTCPEDTFSSALGARSSDTCTACPAGKTAPSGSAENADCVSPTTAASASTDTHEVRITLSLPMTPSAFTDDKQTAFKSSLAQAAGVSSESVVIHKIESISSRRHLLAEAIRVETGIMAADQGAAEAIAGKLTVDSINSELSKAGLPAATVLEAAIPSTTAVSSSSPAPTVSGGSTSDEGGGMSSLPIIGGAVGVVLIGIAVAWWWRRRQTSNPGVTDGVHQNLSSDLVLSVDPPTEVAGFWSKPLAKGADRHAEPGPGRNPEVQDKQADAIVPHIQYSELAVESDASASGSFKALRKAKWIKNARDVAVLVLRNSDQTSLSDMENEIRMFGTLGKHKHLAVLLATCTQPQSQNKCMVMEFAPLGSLDHVLSKADEDGVDASNLVKITIAMQVADGMAHLHLHNVVHRDLAIRNILVFLFDVQNWKNVLIKLSDYGSSLLLNKGLTGGASLVEIGTNSSNAAGPTRWMAPESLKRRSYSKKTDVWSFAVVLYEIWTLGMIPYYAITEDAEVVRRVVDGERLGQPDNCPDPVYVLMQTCWNSAPKDRPSMNDLQTALQEAFAVECLETAKNECVVCLSGEPVMALMPCGHRCACAECGPMLETCPLCRTAVQEAKRIFG